jgi:hypothetical protein
MATLLTLFSVSALLAQDESDSSPEVLKIWLDPDEPSTKSKASKEPSTDVIDLNELSSDSNASIGVALPRPAAVGALGTGAAAIKPKENFSEPVNLDDLGLDQDRSSPILRRKPSIQTIATDDLTLVAVIVPTDNKDDASKVAMLDYKGNNFEIKKGTKVGNKNGFVKEIAENYVIIEEEYTNDVGENTPKDVFLRLD